MKKTILICCVILCSGLAAWAQSAVFRVSFEAEAPIVREGLRRPCWQPGDALSVSPLSEDKDAAGLVMWTEETGQTVSMRADEPVRLMAVCAVWPLSSVHTWNPSGRESCTLQFKTDIKARQMVSPVGEQYGVTLYADPDVLWLAGWSDKPRKETVVLSQIGTYLKFTIPEGMAGTLKRVLLRATTSLDREARGASMGGTVYYNCRADEVKATYAGSAKSITVSNPGGMALRAGVYYVAVRPRCSADPSKNYQGISLVVYAGDGSSAVWIPQISGGCVFEPGRIYDLGEMPRELIFQ